MILHLTKTKHWKNQTFDVTLALVDPTLLSCWEEMVKRGEECTLMLKHSKGQVTATLQSTKQTSILPVPSLSSSASAKKKKKKGNKKKRMEALLAYHQRLVEEKGLPPSRLMLQQAAAAATSPSSSSTLSQSPGTSEISFKCDLCDFTSKSKRGLKVHTGRSHKEKDQQMPVESLRGEEHENSLDISQLRNQRQGLITGQCWPFWILSIFNFSQENQWQRQWLQWRWWWRQSLGSSSDEGCSSTASQVPTVSLLWAWVPEETAKINSEVHATCSVNKVQTCMMSYKLFSK